MTFQDGDRLAVEGNRPRPGLAIAHDEGVAVDLGPAQPDDLVPAAPGEQQEPDNVGLRPAARTGMAIEDPVKTRDLLRRQEAGELRRAVRSDAPRGVGVEMAPCDSEVEDLAQQLERVVGIARRAAAEPVEPEPDFRVGNTVEALRPEGREKAAPQQRGIALPGRGLASDETRLPPFPLHEHLERGPGTRRMDGPLRLRACLPHVIFLPRLLDGHRRDRAERDALCASVSILQHDPGHPAGRAHPDPETGHASVPDCGARGRRREIAASVSLLRSLAGIAQPPSRSPSVSAASLAIASAACVYFSVVSGSACPSSLPMASTVSPCLKAMLAWVWRRS